MTASVRCELSGLAGVAEVVHNPHCAEQRFMSTHAGAFVLLSTGGRSVFVARLRDGKP